MKIPFHRAYIDESEIAAVTEVMRSGWLTMGEKTFQLEREFSGYVGAANSIAVNSCTSALHLALKAIGLNAGDEVIIPAMTFVATWEVIIYFGAVPVIADVEKDTHLLDVNDFERKISPRTKAVIPVHYAGQPCDMDPIIAIAAKHDIMVIEDAAHSLPASYNGAKVGTIGDITCFSFYATKTITTGEGGMITTGKSEWAERMKRLRLHGITKDAWNRYSDKGTWVYDVSEAGYKYNTTDISAAIGIEQLKKSDAMNMERQGIAHRYSEAFKSSDLLHLYNVRPGRESAWHLYPLKLNINKLKITRDQFIEELKSAGIGTSVHFIPLYRFSCMNGSGYEIGHFPGSEYIFEREVSLPVYPGLTDKEIDYIIEKTLSILEKNKR